MKTRLGLSTPPRQQAQAGPLKANVREVGQGDSEDSGLQKAPGLIESAIKKEDKERAELDRQVPTETVVWFYYKL
jgi:hypothetical protein